MTGATAFNLFESALLERQPVASRLLTAAVRRNALSNAYLLSGRAVADKWLISQQLAAFLNCLSPNRDEFFSCLSKYLTENPQRQPLFKTGEQAAKGSKGESLSNLDASFCQNCRWIAQGEHPQAWMLLEGQGESGKIPVEKARLLCDELGKTSRYMRVVVIPHAEQDSLHAAPANALLKNIEEPQDNSLFLLFAASEEQVLPTIVSRSQVIPVINQFKSGLWVAEESSSNIQDAEKNLSDKLASIKSEFIHAARKRLSGTSSLHGSYIKAVSESQDLSDRLQLLSDDDGIEPDLLIDVLLAAELEVLRDSGSRNQQISLYLTRLAELSENSKQQLNHYVRKNNVLETFAYSLTELRSRYLGDFCLAKN